MGEVGRREAEEIRHGLQGEVLVEAVLRDIVLHFLRTVIARFRLCLHGGAGFFHKGFQHAEKFRHGVEADQLLQHLRLHGGSAPAVAAGVQRAHGHVHHIEAHHARKVEGYLAFLQAAQDPVQDLSGVFRVRLQQVPLQLLHLRGGIILQGSGCVQVRGIGDEASAAPHQAELQRLDCLAVCFADGGNRAGQAEAGGHRRAAGAFQAGLQAEQRLLGTVIPAGSREEHREGSFPGQGGAEHGILPLKGERGHPVVRCLAQVGQAALFTFQHPDPVLSGWGEGQSVLCQLFRQGGAVFPGQQPVQPALQQHGTAFLQGQAAGAAFLGQCVQHGLHLAHLIRGAGFRHMAVQRLFRQLFQRLVMPVGEVVDRRTAQQGQRHQQQHQVPLHAVHGRFHDAGGNQRGIVPADGF